MTDVKTKLAIVRPELIECVKKVIEGVAGPVWYDTFGDLSLESTGLMQEAIYNRIVDAISAKLIAVDNNG